MNRTLDLFADEEITKFYFASRDSSGGLRGLDIYYEKVGDNHYRIYRESYKYHCKHTEQPCIDVDDSGLERDAHLRVQMRVKAINKEYVDKGYKQLTKSADDYSIEELDEIVGKYKTFKDGLLKPMLCKMAKNVTNKNTFNLQYFASRKIDGCFTGSTRIITNKGYLRIDDIVKNKLQVKVLSYNFENKKLEYRPIINWFDNGKGSPKEFNSLMVDNSESYPLTCTKNHKFWTDEDWTESQNCTYIKKFAAKNRKSLLIGTLLGDSIFAVDYRSKSLPYRFITSHVELKFVQHVAKVLGLEGQGNFSTRISGYGSKINVFTSRTLSHDPLFDINDYYVLSEKDNRYHKRFFTAEYLLKYLDIDGVSLWYADDGSIVPNNDNWDTPILSIATCAYSKEQCIEFQKYFTKKFGITPDFRVDTRVKNGSGISLKFRTKDSLKLLSLLKNYMFLDKEYKYYYKDCKYIKPKLVLEKIPVQIIPARGGTSKKSKYDIEVEHNHNYFADGYLVHNCRTMIYYDGKEVHAKSRTAIMLDFPLYHIISHPLIKKLFKSNPNLILDGEAYKHGLPLNVISGICRNNSDAKDLGRLEFYMYDIVDISLPFTERLKKMIKIKKLLNLDFNPYRIWKEDELKIQFVPQVPISGWDNMMKLHNQYVEEGWEGLVIRLANATYGPGKRNNNMIKIKLYKENTFKCIGIEQGLREYDDMVFIMETHEGKQFKAKPLGDHEQKVDYTNNFDKFYKGKLADCKYFAISKYGIPQQPALIAFRFDLTEDDLHD